VFYAGATFFADGPASESDNAAWLAARSGEGFEYLRDAGLWRLWRFHYPEQLLAATSIAKQADLLAQFVADAFRALTDNGPPT